MGHSSISRLLTGLDDRHIIEANGVRMHRELAAPLARLRAAALETGIELAVASGFRSFERQLHIWNAKVAGERPVLDDLGRPIDLARLTAVERMYAILRWSALPGASRHHWGTDIDIWDSAAVSPGYRLELVSREYSASGPFARLGGWLERELAEVDTGFYRPFARDAGGVAPEPWHLSYRPLADYYAVQLTPGLLAPVLERSIELCGEPVALCDTVLRHLDDIFDRFVAPPTRPKGSP